MQSVPIIKNKNFNISTMIFLLKTSFKYNCFVGTGFNVLFPEGSAERQRVINRYTCESIGNTYGAGTPNEQTPIGQPCN